MAFVPGRRNTTNAYDSLATKWGVDLPVSQTRIHQTEIGDQTCCPSCQKLVPFGVGHNCNNLHPLMRLTGMINTNNRRAFESFATQDANNRQAMGLPPRAARMQDAPGYCAQINGDCFRHFIERCPHFDRDVILRLKVGHGLRENFTSSITNQVVNFGQLLHDFRMNPQAPIDFQLSPDDYANSRETADLKAIAAVDETGNSPYTPGRLLSVRVANREMPFRSAIIALHMLLRAQGNGNVLYNFANSLDANLVNVIQNVVFPTGTPNADIQTVLTSVCQEVDTMINLRVTYPTVTPATANAYMQAWSLLTNRRLGKLLEGTPVIRTTNGVPAGPLRGFTANLFYENIHREVKKTLFPYS